MTTQKLFKRRVRERMSKTGESYTTARQHLATKREPPGPTWDLASAVDLVSDAKLAAATGGGWQHWLDLLDRWGARERKHGETVEHLISQHGVPGWWAQSITVGFERASGMRRKHQQRGGFTVYASRTIGVGIEDLYGAFVDDDQRAEWLADGSMSHRSSQPAKTARFDWEGGPTRVLVTFESKGQAKSTAYVVHERLPDADAAEAAKAAWKQRLSALKSMLEGG
jgi:uncharacterized protein YndB with AHSA1/START domain